MQVTETKSEGLKRAYSATAPASEIDQKVTQKLEEVRSTAQLPGFRKGKVPLKLLRQRFGKSLMGEVMQELVDDTLKTHFESSGHRPATQPDVKVTNETFDDGDDLDVEFSYEVMPEIPEIDLAGIALERMVVEVADSSVEEALENIAKNAKTFEAKDGAAEDGDQVVIDFVGKVDGEAFEGGAAEDFPLVLGSNQFIPGFEAQLIGASAGDEKAVEVSFPEDYGAENLAGKPAVFDVTVKSVNAAQPHPIDDELAKKYGAENLDGLRTQISDRIGQEYKGAARGLMKRKLLDHLNDAVSFDLPESMVEPEAKQIAHHLWHEENKDTAPDDHSHEAIEPTDEHKDLANRRVKLGLLLADIGVKNKIEVTDPELQTAIMERAREYPGQEKAFFDFVTQNEQMRESIRAPLFEDKVVDYIFELAAVSDKTVPLETLKQALEAEEETDAAA